MKNIFFLSTNCSLFKFIFILTETAKRVRIVIFRAISDTPE